MIRTPGAILICLLALLAYGNSLGNGFAYDDNAVILRNPVVAGGDLGAALETPYHPDALEGAGLYRPLISASFTLEWMAFGNRPLPYHLLNVAAHAVVSLLLFLFLLDLSLPLAALLGASVFAVHPLHTEAVANVVGRTELYSAAFYLMACLLYWKGWRWQEWKRGLRLAGVAVLYGLSLSAKEIGVTLPLVLLALEALRPRLAPVSRGEPDEGTGPDTGRLRMDGTFWVRLRKEGAIYLLLLAVLLVYWIQRRFVLGTWMGEVPAPVFQLLSPGQRLFTALSLWPEYLRLLLFPLELSSDYAPGVLFPAEAFTGKVALGMVILVGLAYFILRASKRAGAFSLMALGCLWLFLTVLPVSNLFFPTGVLLAERTLYLPSVAMSLVVAGGVARIAGWPARYRQWVYAGIAVVLVGFLGRAVARNPTWASTRTVLETLNRNHPESHLAFLHRGLGLESRGEIQEARDQLDTAVRLAPLRYGTLTAVAGFLGRTGHWNESEALLRRALALAPSRDDAYRLLAAQLLRRNEGYRAHRLALSGLARSESNADLWGAVSESYLLRGDLPAARRAREAALSADPESPHHWRRMGQILEALGQEDGASEARRKALRLEERVRTRREDLPESSGGVARTPAPGGPSSDQRGPST